jgi:signal transduction histidine kinase
MMPLAGSRRHRATVLLRIATAAMAAGVFVVDTVVPHDLAVGVAYIVIILMASRFCMGRALLLVGAGCLALIILSYLLSPPVAPPGYALLNLTLRSVGIGAATLLAWQNQSAQAAVRASEEALRRSEAYLGEAQRLSHTGTFAFNATAAVYWSDESYRIWKFDPLQGLPDRETVLQRIHPGDRERVNVEIEEALRQKRGFTLEFRIVLPDGTVKYIESAGHPLLSADGELLEMVATHVDVTERKRAQEQSERLRQLEADLAHMNRLGIIGELTASLAHEILHPIAAARNNARAGMRFLEMSPPNLGEGMEALACAVRDADRAKDIVGRIRHHIKKAPPRKELFDLNEAIHEVIAMVLSAIDQNRVSVRTRLMDGLNPVHGDRVQLQQVVLNLILNAVEAMSSVEDGVRELSISTTQNQTSDVLVAVQDTGPGIDPEHLERVFAPFYTTKTNGLGMGLSICRSIIAAHGGRLWAEANRPRGATVQFTLPARLEDS